MYNKRSLSKDTKASKAPKSISKPKDIILDPMGQWKYPGQNTRIPGNDITMQGVNYPVLGVGSDGQKQMMYPGQDYKFQGADYVDEYPQMKKGGGLKSKKYSRDLEATNYLFHESPLFKKPKSKKKKIYHPKAKHYQEGGDAMNGMMKARLAYANEFGNPAAKRMINIPDNPYQFDNGDIGTHYMASMDNYAVPQIQDENGQLMLGDYGPDSNEAMRFDSDEDANYFAEHYKDVSPGFMEMELTPEEIQQYRDGGYVVEDLEEMQKGGSRKSIGISDPKEYAYRKAAYDDSLALYKNNKEFIEAKEALVKADAKLNRHYNKKNVKAFNEAQRLENAVHMKEHMYHLERADNPLLKGLVNVPDRPVNTHYAFKNSSGFNRPVQHIYKKKKKTVEPKFERTMVDEVPEPPVNDFADIRLPILPLKTIERQYPDEIIQRPSSLYPKQEGDIVPPQSKEIWKTLPDGTRYRIERPIDPRLTKPVKVGFYQKGGRTYDGYDPEFDPYAGVPLPEHEKLKCFIPPQPEDFDDGIIPYYILKRYSDWYSKNGYEIKPPMRPDVVMTPRSIDRDALEPKYAEETPTWNFKAPEIDLPLKVREDHKGEQVGTTKQPIYETRVVPTMGADGIYRNVYKKVIVGYQDVQGMQYHNEEPTFHNLETGSSSGYKEGGALLTKKVTCKKCGWKWDANDGGNDVTTCHKCGGQGLVHAQKGGSQIYKYADRPEASYKKDAKGNWLISLPSTKGKYVPIKDPTGKRAGELNEKAKPLKFDMPAIVSAEEKYHDGPIESADWLWSLPIALPAIGQFAAGAGAMSLPGMSSVPGATLGNAVNSMFIANSLYKSPENAKDWYDVSQGKKDWKDTALGSAEIAAGLFGSGSGFKSLAQDVKAVGKNVSQLPNKIATGNSALPIAWKVEKPTGPIKSSDYIKRKYTDEEIELLDKYGKGMWGLTPEDWVKMEKLTKSGATDFSKGDYPISRVLGYYKRGSQENEIIKNLKRGDVFKTPTEESIRTWTAGVPKGGFPGGSDTRLIIPSRYTKNLGNNFSAMPYYDKRLDFIYNPNGTLGNYNAVLEKELMGNIPGGFKVIGKTANDGKQTLFIKPHNSKKGPLSFLGLKEGGVLSKAQTGVNTGLTSEDYMDVYNNSLELQNYMKGLSSQGYKPWSSEENESFGKMFSTPEEKWARMQKSVEGFDPTTTVMPTTGTDIRKDLTLSDYYEPIDDNRFKQREISHGVINPNVPMGLYDKRIPFHSFSGYTGPSSGSFAADNIQLPLYDSAKLKEEMTKLYPDIQYNESGQAYTIPQLPLRSLNTSTAPQKETIIPAQPIPAEPQTATVKKYNAKTGKWVEIQVPANSPEVEEDRKRWEYAKKNKEYMQQQLGNRKEGGMTMGQEVDLTPEQEAYLRKLGYKLERI